MTLADSLRDAVSRVQAVSGKLGLRTHRVYLHRESWSGIGAGVGDGSATATVTEITQDGQPPPCVPMTERDARVFGDFAEDSLRLGPLTIASGGIGDIDPAVFAPADMTAAQTYHIRVTGGALGTTGRLYRIARVHWQSSYAVLVHLEPVT